MKYKFALIDAGSRQRAQAAGSGGSLWGVGIGSARIAPGYTANMPSQGIGGATRTLASAALSYPLPPAGATLAATAASLDALTAMALLAMRADGRVISGEISKRLTKVMVVIRAEAEWLPVDNRAPLTAGHALQAFASDANQDVAQRVAAIRSWLETERFPGLSQAFAAARRERAEQSELAKKVWLTAGGRIAVLASQSRFATRVALCSASVAVVDNPAYGAGDTRPYRRVTIALRVPQPLKLELVRDELDTIERGWGPEVTLSQTTINSPAGRSCTLPRPRIIMAVKRNLAGAGA
jgi:hypothetical protein